MAVKKKGPTSGMELLSRRRNESAVVTSIVAIAGTDEMVFVDTSTGQLSTRGELAREHLEAVGFYLADTSKKVFLAVAQWMDMLEGRPDYKEILKMTGFAQGTLYQIAHVTRSFPLDFLRRLKKIGMSHLQAISQLPNEDERLTLAEQADNEGLTQNRLRDIVRERKKATQHIEGSPAPKPGRKKKLQRVEAVLEHPEIQKISYMRAYCGRILPREFGRMNAGEKDITRRALMAHLRDVQNLLQEIPVE